MATDAHRLTQTEKTPVKYYISQPVRAYPVECEAYSSMLGRCGSVAILLDLAAMEEILKGSIIFYLGMKEIVPENFGKSKIDTIIKEETSHIKLLRGKLVALKKQSTRIHFLEQTWKAGVL